MPGSSFYVSFNGRRFALPEDNEPEVTIGGVGNKEALRNGDGTAVPQKTFNQGAVRGFTPRMRLSNGDLEAMQGLVGKAGVSMVYSGPDGVFEGSGFIVSGEEGVKMNQGTGVIESIDFWCESGNPLKRG